MSKRFEARARRDAAQSKLRRLERYKPSEQSVIQHAIACAEARVEVAQANLDLTRAYAEDYAARGAVEVTREVETEDDEGRVRTIAGHGLAIRATEERDGETVLLTVTGGELNERQTREMEDDLYGEAFP